MVLLAVFFCGALFGRYVPHTHSNPVVDMTDRGSNYKFIDPLLFCQDQNVSSGTADELENEISIYIEQKKKTGEIIDAAFYFKDLNGGPWALVNRDFKSAPASLLKVPLAMSVYQKAEKDPAFLLTKVSLPKEYAFNQNEHFQPEEKIQPLTQYSVEDLVKYMLQYSDNAAVYLLGNLFNIQELQDAYIRLGMQAPRAAEEGYTMTIKTFASFFRVLYNGTYLTQSDSEHVLSLLSQSSFTKGLVAGVPSGVVVAHKFGETSQSDGIVRLNDCGIVYKPNQPYLICVMTEGTNHDTLANVISSISKKVYTTTLE